MSSDRTMGVTNGIELSPDGATPYVGESRTKLGARAFWPTACRARSSSSDACSRISPSSVSTGCGLISTASYSPHDPMLGTVAVFAPDGTPLPEIPLLNKGPTNLAFGGPDGKTVFVTQSEGGHGFIEAFRVDRPGREFCMLRPGGSC
jgi:sugar lactone lactonase YvrE